MYVQAHALAAKKHFSPELRKVIGTDELDKFEPHTLTWDELHRSKQGVFSICKKAVELAEKRTEKDIEDSYTVLMKVHDEIEAEMDCRKRIGNNGPRSHGGDHRRPVAPDAIAHGEDRGQPLDSSTRDEGKISTLLSPEQRMSDVVGRGSIDRLSGLSVGRYFRAMVTGGSTEAERRALAEGSDSSGGFSVPEVLSANLIDLMRSRTVAINAGARTVPLASDKNHIAKLATDPVPAWRAENAIVNESDPTFTRVTFEPKSLAVLVRVSRELLEDSLNIETELPRILAAAMARELDRVIFVGSGSLSEPSGLDVIGGVLSLPHNAAITNYGPLVTARRNLMRENIEGVSAYVMHPDVEAEFGGLVDTTGQPLRHPPILDRPKPLAMLTTTMLPTNLGVGGNEATIYCGDFTQLVIGMRSDIRVEVLKERFADNMQYGFLCHARYDAVPIHPQAFCRITGIQL